jgi:MFS family permease
MGVQGAALSTWAIFYFTSIIEMPNAILIATAIAMLGMLGAILGTAVGGRIGDRFYQGGKVRGRVLISVVGLLIGIALFFVLYTIPFHSATVAEAVGSTSIFIVLSIVANFFASVCAGNIFAIFSEVTLPELRSISNSLLGVLVNLGGVMGNIIVASLVELDSTLLRLGISIVLAVWLFGTAFWVITYIYYPREAQELRINMANRREEYNNRLSDHS